MELTGGGRQSAIREWPRAQGYTTAALFGAALWLAIGVWALVPSAEAGSVLRRHDPTRR